MCYEERWTLTVCNMMKNGQYIDIMNNDTVHHENLIEWAMTVSTMKNGQRLCIMKNEH